MNNKLIWLIVIGAVLLFSGEKKKASSMSGLRRKRSLRGLGAKMIDTEYETKAEKWDAQERKKANKQFQAIVDTAARILRDKDINERRLNIPLANEMVDRYKELLRPFAMQLLLEETPHLYIPKMLATRFLDDNYNLPIYVPPDSKENVAMAMTNPRLLSSRQLTQSRSALIPKKFQKEMTPDDKKQLDRLIDMVIANSQGKIIPEKEGQMTLFGGIKGMVRIEDIEKEYGKRIPKKFRENLKSYIDNPDVQSFIRKSLAYKLSDSDYKTLYKIGCHPDNKPKCKYPGLNYVTTIFIHPVTKWQVVAEKVERLEKAIDREEARKPKGQVNNPRLKIVGL